jgi:aldose sugar dehydrogenase
MRLHYQPQPWHIALVVLLIPLFSLLHTGCKKTGKEVIVDDIPREFTLEQEEVASGIPIPWGMTFVNDSILLVSERGGMLYEVNVKAKTTIELGRIAGVTSFGQGGFMDLKTHPAFASNAWVYYTYTKRAGVNYTTAVGRFKYINRRVESPEDVFVTQAVTSSGVHFGSRLVFDRQGYLYVSIGDRGQMQLAQQTTNHIGCVLRLMDDGSVPPDNPFVGRADTLPEIWTYGNRNIQGMDVHPVTGEIWSHEHGPQGGDEINLMQKGANHGWPLVTFGLQYGGGIISVDTAMEGVMPPLFYWKPSIAPCGMAFIKGGQYPGWEGSLLSGSLVLQHLNRMEFSHHKPVLEERYFKEEGRIRNVVMSPDGFIYIANETRGSIIKVKPVFK